MTVNTREKSWVLERESRAMLLFLTVWAETSTLPATVPQMLFTSLQTL